MHGNTENIKGNRYGNLTVLELTELKLEHKRGAVWKCRCDCGNICYKTATDLKDKRRKTCSCGCKSRRKRTFPNKFVKKETVTRVDKARDELSQLILEKFKDASYIEELKEGITEILSDLDKKSMDNQFPDTQQ